MTASNDRLWVCAIIAARSEAAVASSSESGGDLGLGGHMILDHTFEAAAQAYRGQMARSLRDFKAVPRREVRSR